MSFFVIDARLKPRPLGLTLKHRAPDGGGKVGKVEREALTFSRYWHGFAHQPFANAKGRGRKAFNANEVCHVKDHAAMPFEASVTRSTRADAFGPFHCPERAFLAF